MKNNVYSVSQINNYIRLLLDSDVLLSDIYIEGEISNYKEHSSGHLYFTVKDENSALNCVMYSSNAIDLKFDLKNGLKIVVFGYISSYVKTGSYQLYVKDISILGKGNLQDNFETLKEKLLKKGYFDIENKIEIPKYPKTIAIITSNTGAAVYDILNIAKRRNKTVKLIIIPTLVQGKDAPDEIAYAIELANEYKKIDTIILARGGGSTEDLWCFNDEKVAKAILLSKIPIITGIGHEIDFTIADFTADLRAPTPSAAIEIALFETDNLNTKINNYYYKINNLIERKILEEKTRYSVCTNSYYFKNFINLIMDYQILVENNLNTLEKRIKDLTKEKKFLLQTVINKLDSLSPTNILKNGYCFISDEKNNAIKLAKNLKKDDKVKISFYDGEKKAKILE